MRPLTLFLTMFLCILLPCAYASPLQDILPTTFAEGEGKIQQQGTGSEASDYQRDFLASSYNPLKQAADDGAIGRGKYSFDLICIISSDGHITRVLTNDDKKDGLGKYVANKLKGVQVPKPPRDNWAIYISMGHP